MTPENTAVHGIVPLPVLLGGPPLLGPLEMEKGGPSLPVLLGHLLPENGTGSS